MMTEQTEKKHNKLLVAVVFLLLIAIGVLLWLLLRPQPEPTKIPTGNVDVFHIKVTCLCGAGEGDDDGDGGEECNPDDGQTGTPGAEGYKSYHGSTINDHTDTTVDDEGIIYVDDKNGWYVYQQNLQIFQNAAFEYTNKIAPGVSNSYNFKVHNETKNAVRYNIEFEEGSEYAVNMKYRLKRGGSYVVGDANTWVTADELTLATMKLLASDGVDSYTLDWQWPYEGGVDALDTEIGENMTSDYTLGIKINFEEV